MRLHLHHSVIICFVKSDLPDCESLHITLGPYLSFRIAAVRYTGGGDGGGGDGGGGAGDGDGDGEGGGGDGGGGDIGTLGS